MEIDACKFPVRSGDLIHIAPHSLHTLRNTTSDSLEFLSVYSEDFEISSLPKDAVITAAPPTPNGSLHLGHISGPYLAADVLSRYLTLQGSKVSLESGTDDHQNYVALAASAQGIATRSFKASMRQKIQNAFAASQISWDVFTEPSEQLAYQEETRIFYSRCKTAGLIEKKQMSLPHCDPCGHILRDGLLSGSCPECHASSSGGCESCGIVLSPDQVLNPTCSLCQTPGVFKEATVHVFDLGKHLPNALPQIQKLKLPEATRTMIANVSRKQTYSHIVSYPKSSSGHESEIIADDEQAIHVWFEMAAQYFKYATNETYWVHCFGFDNAFYYLLFIPALHAALSSKAKLPDAVVTNMFLHLEGQKFSTSRKHAIWADEFSGDSDHLRLFLAMNRPQSKSDNFSLRDFSAFSKTLGLQLESVHQMIQPQSDSTNPRSVHQAVQTANRFTKMLELYYDPSRLDLRRSAGALRELLDEVVSGDHDSQSKKILITAFAVVASPLMPKQSKELLQQLKISNPRWVADWSSFT